MWNERWFFLKETCFGYMNPRTGRIGSVVLFDQGFEVSSGSYSRGLHKGMQLSTLSRHLTIKCWTRSKRKSWVNTFKKFANQEGILNYILVLLLIQYYKGCWVFSNVDDNVSDIW